MKPNEHIFIFITPLKQTDTENPPHLVRPLFARRGTGVSLLRPSCRTTNTAVDEGFGRNTLFCCVGSVLHYFGLEEKKNDCEVEVVTFSFTLLWCLHPQWRISRRMM